MNKRSKRHRYCCKYHIIHLRITIVVTSLLHVKRISFFLNLHLNWLLWLAMLFVAIYYFWCILKNPSSRRTNIFDKNGQLLGINITWDRLPWDGCVTCLALFTSITRNTETLVGDSSRPDTRSIILTRVIFARISCDH